MLNIILFNHGAERVFGYQAAEVMGQPLDLLVPDHARARHGDHAALDLLRTVAEQHRTFQRADHVLAHRLGVAELLEEDLHDALQLALLGRGQMVEVGTHVQ